MYKTNTRGALSISYPPKVKKRQWQNLLPVSHWLRTTTIPIFCPIYHIIYSIHGIAYCECITIQIINSNNKMVGAFKFVLSSLPSPSLVGLQLCACYFTGICHLGNRSKLVSYYFISFAVILKHFTYCLSILFYTTAYIKFYIYQITN